MQYKTISKKELIETNEEDVMFITNPGRMGDEDGITLVIRKDNDYITYRVEGLMYPNKEINEKDTISLDVIAKQFPEWFNTWKNCNEKDYHSKYKYIYMGFGNGLCVDNSIYSEFETYLNKQVEEYLQDETDKESLKYAAIYNTWHKALNEMLKEKNIILKR